MGQLTRKILSKRAMTMKARRTPSGYCPSTSSSSGELAFVIEPSSLSVGESSRYVFPSFSNDEREEGATVLPTSLSPAKVVVLESILRFDSTMYYMR
jgi:hypothetical protein